MKMTQDINRNVLVELIRPLVSLCLRHSFSIQDLTNAAKEAFVQEAVKEIQKTSTKVNVSRLSVLTGMYRKDVTRIFREKKSPLEKTHGILGRVVGRWHEHKDYRNSSGTPRVLSYHGEKSEFRRLVRDVSTSIHPGTVLFELLRIRAVEKTPEGLRLRHSMPALSPDPEKGLQVLADDLQTLIQAVEENVFVRKRISNLHIRTEYDNIVKKHIPEIRQWLINEGKAFHKRAREFLSQFDHDINPGSAEEEAGARVVLSAFSWTPPMEPEVERGSTRK